MKISSLFIDFPYGVPGWFVLSPLLYANLCSIIIYLVYLLVLWFMYLLVYPNGYDLRRIGVMRIFSNPSATSPFCLSTFGHALLDMNPEGICSVRRISEGYIRQHVSPSIIVLVMPMV